jgi:hypothetical protein
MDTGTALTTGTPLNGRNVLIVCGLSLLYLLVAALLLGYKNDQLFLVLLFNTFFFLSGATRRFILGFIVFIAFWVLFDFMKAFPNYRYLNVHIGDIYALERRLFGIHGLTPNEYWLAHRRVFLDVAAGFFYLCWMPLPLAFAGYLFYKDKTVFLKFGLNFLLVNLIGFVIYYVFPAAPPWYVEQYGFQFIPHTPGNTAGLGRWDSFFHVSVFAGLYSRSSNVFAAMPSLHAAYPLTVLYYGVRSRLGRWNALFALITGGIWFAAVYASHHYVLDVLAGIGCGIAGISLFNYWYGKGGWLMRQVRNWARAISPTDRVPPQLVN